MDIDGPLPAATSQFHRSAASPAEWIKRPQISRRAFRFRCSCFGGALYEPLWLAHTVGSASVFLGATRLFACGGVGVRPHSFGHFLERGSDRYGTLPRCAFGIARISESASNLHALTS